MKKVDLTQNMSITFTFTKTKHTQFLHNCRYILGIKGVDLKKNLKYSILGSDVA